MFRELDGPSQPLADETKIGQKNRYFNAILKMVHMRTYKKDQDNLYWIIVLV